MAAPHEARGEGWGETEKGRDRPVAGKCVDDMILAEGQELVNIKLKKGGCVPPIIAGETKGTDFFHFLYANIDGSPVSGRGIFPETVYV